MTSSGSVVSAKVEKPRRSRKTTVISRRWVFRGSSAPPATMSSARCGEKKRFNRPEPLDLGNLLADALLERAAPLEQPVVETLFLEAGADAGAQENRVEGLRQVVRRTQLDAADDALQLVHGRDHDHGDRAEPFVGLERLQHLVAVELRHHDVQENQIERSRPQELQRLAAVPRSADIRVPLATEALGQGVEVVLVVVDHQERGPVLAHRVSRGPGRMPIGRLRLHGRRPRGGSTHGGRGLRKERPDLLEEPGEVDRLRIEVVAARRQRPGALALHGVGRERDDGDGASPCRRLQPPRSLPAVQNRQTQVHEDERRRLAGGHGDALLAVPGHDDGEARPRQPAAEHVDVVVVVLDVQDLRHRGPPVGAGLARDDARQHAPDLGQQLVALPRTLLEDPLDRAVEDPPVLGA